MSSCGTKEIVTKTEHITPYIPSNLFEPLNLVYILNHGDSFAELDKIARQLRDNLAICNAQKQEIKMLLEE